MGLEETIATTLAFHRKNRVLASLEFATKVLHAPFLLLPFDAMQVLSIILKRHHVRRLDVFGRPFLAVSTL